MQFIKKILITAFCIILVSSVWAENGVNRSEVIIGTATNLEGSTAGVAEEFNAGITAYIEKINKAAASIFFATGSSILLAKSNAALNNVVAILKANPDYRVDINGYTDNQGNADKNKALSEARANAVKAYLLTKGIPQNRLVSTGHGTDKPIADNKTPAGRNKNRRVEMKVRNY